MRPVDRVGNFAGAVAARELADDRRSTRNAGARRGASPLRKAMDENTKTLLGVDADAPEAALVERLTALRPSTATCARSRARGDTEAARGALRSLAKRAGEPTPRRRHWPTSAPPTRRPSALRPEACALEGLTPAELGADAEGRSPGAEAEWVGGHEHRRARGYLEGRREGRLLGRPAGRDRARRARMGLTRSSRARVSRRARCDRAPRRLDVAPAEARDRITRHDAKPADRLRIAPEPRPPPQP